MTRPGMPRLATQADMFAGAPPPRPRPAHLRLVPPPAAEAEAVAPLTPRPPPLPRQACPLMAERVSLYLARGAAVSRDTMGWTELTLPSGRQLCLSPASAPLYGL